MGVHFNSQNHFYANVPQRMLLRNDDAAATQVNSSLT